MALPTKVLPGFSASLYCQPGAAPTPLTTANLSVYASVSAIAVSAQLVPVEAIPSFGQDDAVANFSVAGSRQSDKIPVQSAPTSMTVVAAWNPSDTNLLLLRGDAYNGTIDRTFVISEFRGDLHAMAKGHPFTLEEVDAALQEASPGGAEAVCLSVLRAHVTSK